MQVVHSARRPSPRGPTATSTADSRATSHDDPFAGGLAVSPRRSAAAAVGVSMPPPQVTDLRRPSIDVLMMPSGPAAPPTHVQTVELGDPLSPRSAAAGGGGAGSGSSSSGRLQPVGEAVALAPEPEVAAASVGSPQRPNPKQDRWAGGIVEGHGVYTGWMLKKGETGNSWKRRYFACSIADKTLSYYDKPGGEKRATLDLSACHDLLELTQESEPRFIFELQFPATSYRIAAEDEAGRRAWKAAIANALYVVGSGGGRIGAATGAGGSGSGEGGGDAGHASGGAGQDAASKDRWVNDEDVTNCQGPGCSRPFSYIWRRHHCRVCGGVFCDSCAPKDAIEINDPLTGKLKKERACGACVGNAVREREAVRLGRQASLTRETTQPDGDDSDDGL